MHFRSVWHYVDRIVDRRGEEGKVRMQELAAAACVPHMTQEDREAFFRKLVNRDPAGDTGEVTREHVLAEAAKWKKILSQS